MVGSDSITPPASGAMFDSASQMWEGYANGVFIGLFGSEGDALAAVKGAESGAARDGNLPSEISVNKVGCTCNPEPADFYYSGCGYCNALDKIGDVLQRANANGYSLNATANEVIQAISPYLSTTKPVSSEPVPIEKCVKAATQVLLTETDTLAEDVTLAVLDAAGVTYVE